jgi:hypothetical protein
MIASPMIRTGGASEPDTVVSRPVVESLPTASGVCGELKGDGQGGSQPPAAVDVAAAVEDLANGSDGHRRPARTGLRDHVSTRRDREVDRPGTNSSSGPSPAVTSGEP